MCLSSDLLSLLDIKMLSILFSCDISNMDVLSLVAGHLCAVCVCLFGLWIGADLLTGPDEMMLTGQIKDAQFDVPTRLNNRLYYPAGK